MKGKLKNKASGKAGTSEAPGISTTVIIRLFLKSISIGNKSVSTGFCPGREQVMPRGR